MDQSTESLTSHIDTTIPAHLLIGSSDAAYKRAVILLQQQLCQENGCGGCSTCRMIKEQQHASVLWFHPEKNYTRDQLDPLFAQLAFELNTNETFFFVIEKADFLTAACANSLLKSVEEPPRGYHFLFLAERLSGVVPTIRSRCAIHHLSVNASSYRSHPLFDFFTSTTFHDPAVFTKALDQSGITERESVELIDALLSHWIEAYRTALMAENTQSISESTHAIDLFSEAHSKQPMPGSSKLFWRDLFLEIKAI